jgi:hypothetical protein
MANPNPIRERDAKGRIISNKVGAGNAPSGNNGRDFVDPVAAGQAAGEPSEPGSRPPKRPNVGTGAPGGTGPAAKPAKEKSASLDLSAAAGLIGGFHAIIAMQRNEPHWLLNDDDAKRYGTALANALRHMPIKAAQKTIDYSTLVMVAFVMETPRIVRSVQLARAPKQQFRPQAVVYPFAPPQPASPPSSPAATATSPTDGAGLPPIAEGPPDLSAFGGEGPGAP